MIPYLTIRGQMASALDAENSDRYLDQQDYIPAVNYAIQMACLAFNEIFAQKKFSESVLKELILRGEYKETISFMNVDWTMRALDQGDVMLAFDEIKDDMELKIKSITGVIESGLFINYDVEIIVA